MPEQTFPLYGVAYTFPLTLFKGSAVVTNPTMAAGDVLVSTDFGAFTNLDTLPAVTPAGGDQVQVDVSVAEMTGYNVCLIFKDASGDEWDPVTVTLRPTAAWTLARAAKLDWLTGDAYARLTGTVELLVAAQAIRDAMKLDAGVGAPAAGSVDAHLDTVVGYGAPPAMIGAQAVRDAMKLDASAGAPAAGSVDTHLDDILLDTGTDGVKVGTGAISPASLTTGLDVYGAKVWMLDDNVGLADRWVVTWFKNGAPVDGGDVTDPAISVYDAAGAAVITAGVMTRIGTTDAFVYSALLTERLVSGGAYVAEASATIGGATRSAVQPMGRDS